jgi:hypothetical protein
VASRSSQLPERLSHARMHEQGRPLVTGSGLPNVSFETSGRAQAPCTKGATGPVAARLPLINYVAVGMLRMRGVGETRFAPGLGNVRPANPDQLRPPLAEAPVARASPSFTTRSSGRNLFRTDAFFSRRLMPFPWSGNCVGVHPLARLCIPMERSAIEPERGVERPLHVWRVETQQ